MKSISIMPLLFPFLFSWIHLWWIWKHQCGKVLYISSINKLWEGIPLSLHECASRKGSAVLTVQKKGMTDFKSFFKKIQWLVQCTVSLLLFYSALYFDIINFSLSPLPFFQNTRKYVACPFLLVSFSLEDTQDFILTDLSIQEGVYWQD